MATVQCGLWLQHGNGAGKERGDCGKVQAVVVESKGRHLEIHVSPWPMWIFANCLARD